MKISKHKRLSLFLSIVLVFELLCTSFVQRVNATELRPEDELINIALGKGVTASSFWDTASSKGYPEYVVDGAIGNGHRWISKYTKGVDKPEWVTIDLGEVYLIDEIHINFEAAYALKYDILGSIDNENFTEIKKVDDGKSGITVHSDMGRPQVRYLKFDLKKQANLNYGYSIHEIEVYDYSVVKKVPISAEKMASFIQDQKPLISEDGKKIILPEQDNEDFEITLFGSDNKQVIAMDGSIIQPLHDMKVNLLYKIANKNDINDVATTTKDVSIVIPGKFNISLEDNLKPNVLPGLREWKGETGNYNFNSNSRIIVNDDELIETAKTIKEYFKDMLGKEVSIDSGEAHAGDIKLEVGSSIQEVGKEGYYLNVNDFITITSPTMTGSLYGGISIIQILYQNQSNLLIPKGIARDYPKYEVRAGMIDIGRVFIPLEYLEEMTVYMAWFKLNEVQVHLNDYWSASNYSAFRLQSEVYPEIVAEDGYYTKDEYRDYQKKMVKYGIDVVSEIDTPYHAESFRAIPGVKMLKKGAIDIRDEYSYTVIENLFDEYLDGEDPVIISDKFHIGTDEYDQNYSEDMRKWTDHFIKYINGKGKETRIWGSLGGGTADNGFEGETPVSTDATMNIWAPYWSDVKEMYNLGYDIINTAGGWLYIVPAGAAGYPDRLDIKYLYDNFEVNNYSPDRFKGKGDAIMPIAHPQTKGAEWAIWNDNTSFNIGFSEVDIFDRAKDAIAIVSEKTWYGEPEVGQNSDQFEQRVDSLINRAGNSNPSRYVESKDKLVASYDAANLNGDRLIDSSENGYDAIIYGTNTENEKLIFDKNSYMKLPMNSIGYPYTVRMKLEFMSYDENSVLFAGKDGTLYANIDGSGKVGYERLHGRFIFDYEIPLNEEIDMLFVGDDKNLNLYINGILTSTGKLITDPLNNREQQSSTFVLPLERILEKSNVILSEFEVYNYAMSRDEIAEKYSVSGYSENIAKSKAITASSSATNLSPELAIDGDSTTRWGSNYKNGVEKPEWILLDLEDEYTISEIRISWESAYASGYKIQGSLDGVNYFDIKTITNGQGNLDIHKDFGTKDVRYIKFDLNTQGRADKKYGFSIWEIQVYENTSGEAIRVAENAINEMKQYTRGYEKGNLPVELYDEWMKIFENYIKIADESTLSEAKKVAIVSDIVNRMNAIQDYVLKEASVDKTDLKEVYEIALNLNLNNYTDESIKILNQSISDAKNVLDNPASNQEIINNTLLKLNKSIDNLELITDKQVLSQIISEAKQLNEKDYKPSSWTTFIEVKEIVNAVLENDSVSQDDIDKAVSALKEAMLNLSYKADITNLNKTLKIAAELEKSNYTEATWASFEKKYKLALEFVANPEADQVDVDSANEALQVAIQNLESVDSNELDFTDLDILINKAKKINENDYTVKSFDLFKQILRKVESEKIEVETQEAIKVLINRLEAAFNLLILKDNALIDIPFKGLPDVIRVGDTFTLVPEYYDNGGYEGWEFDKTFFSVSFNSTVIFTALKEGTTTISYTDKLGRIQMVTVKIQANDIVDADNETPNLPVTGDESYMLYGAILLILYGFVIRRKRVKSV